MIGNYNQWKNETTAVRPLTTIMIVQQRNSLHTHVKYNLGRITDLASYTPQKGATAPEEGRTVGHNCDDNLRTR